MDTSTGIALFALALSGWVFYRNTLMPASIKVCVGDSIDIVKHYGPDMPNSIQVACTFTNEGAKTGVIEKMALVIHPAEGPPHLLRWSIFFKYEKGYRATPKEKVHAIPVLARHTHFEGIQFAAFDEIAWSPGKYRIELLGWFNRNCEEDPNIRHDLNVTVTEQLVHDISPEDNGELEPELHTVMLDGFEYRGYPSDIKT
ncbi:hypothetical protein ACFL2T_00570 [Elusimicrobiota bacterium]